MENDGLSEFSGREFTQRTCLDIVEVVMDDGEVISRREVSLNLAEDLNFRESSWKFGDNGKNCGGFEVKSDVQNRFLGGVFQGVSIPARGNFHGHSFEQVEIRGADTMNSKLPPNVEPKASETGNKVKNLGNSTVGNSKNSVNSKVQNNQIYAGNIEDGHSVVNLKFPENGQTSRGESKVDIRGSSSGVNLKLPINGEVFENDQKHQLNGTVRSVFRGGIQTICKKNSVVNLKLPKNGHKCQTVDSENGINAMNFLQKNGRRVDFENDVNVMNSRQPENCRPADLESDVNVMNLRQPKNGYNCEKMEIENSAILNLRQLKNGYKCQKMEVENGVILNLRQPKNGYKCQKMDIENGVTLNLRQPKNGFKCQKMDIENVTLNLRQPKNGQMDVGNGNLRGGISLRSPIAEPQPKKCPSAEWGVAGDVKEELFRGLGLVPRGVLHDNGRPVDRRHCVTGRRTVQADPELAERGPAERPRNVFYPSGVPTMFDTEKFIGEIQRRPAIYDVRSKIYSNRVAKLKHWHEVGKEMYKGWEDLDQMERRSLVKELQIKWKSIRDHFMRQLKQNINGEGPKKKKYVHFDQLQFLTANLGVKRPRHSYKLPKQEPEEEYMEFTPELPEERHFSFVTSVERADYDEREVPVAALLPTPQPEDLSYHKEPLYYHHQDLSYHKELEGDRMGNKMFLLSLLPIMERLPDHANIRARLQLMEVLQAFVAHEDAPRRDYYNHHNAIEKRDACDASQQHSTTSHSDSDS